METCFRTKNEGNRDENITAFTLKYLPIYTRVDIVISEVAQKMANTRRLLFKVYCDTRVSRLYDGAIELMY